MTRELHVASITAAVCSCVTASCWQQHQRCDVMDMKMFANLDKVKCSTGKRTGRQTASVQLTVLPYSEGRVGWVVLG